MYLTTVYNVPAIIWFDPLLAKMCAKMIFAFSWPVSLTCVDLKFAPVVTVVQRYVSTAFLVRENQRQENGQTGQGATLNAAPKEGCII